MAKERAELLSLRSNRRMDKLSYMQRYAVEDKKPIKVVCLALCILLDLVVLSGIIVCLSTKNYFDLLYYGVILIIDMAIRVLTLFLTYEVIVAIQNDNIKIVKKYPIRQVVIYDGETRNIKIERYVGKEKKYNFEQRSIYINEEEENIEPSSINSERDDVEQCSRSDKDDKKYLRLCSKSCEENVYMIELLERRYLIYLQDYTYSLIEVSSDLS